MRNFLRRDFEPRAISVTVEHLGNTAEARKRNRDGRSQTVIRESRNGLPRPPVQLDKDGKPVWYAYGGTGTDQLLGTYGDEWLDRPRDW